MKTALRKLAGLISPSLSGALVCAACGGEFSCGAGLRGCWCSEIQLSDETRAEMRSRYRGCLCRQCLEQLSARAVAALAVDNAR